jgi:large subunit ribosomal protein L2
MGLRSLKPTSHGTRFVILPDFKELTTDKPEKSLLTPLRKTGGRNNVGDTTSRFRGGGVKRMYRIIDFKREKDNIVGTVKTIEYDPNRSTYIALVAYRDGEKRYILAPLGLQVGDTILSGEKVEPKLGNCMPMANIPVGLLIHNVELTPGKGGQIARSAGASVQLAAKEGDSVVLNFPSGEARKVCSRCKATIGQLSNLDHQNIVIGKAGRSRWRGRRPHVRGSAMNPVDHPLGGGDGKSGEGRPPCSPTGRYSKGRKTRSRKKPSNKHIIHRRKK